MLKIRLIIFFCFALASFAIGQSGANAYVGLGVASTKDNNVTADGEQHSGYIVGLDARLAGEDMYFIIGGQYATISMFSEESLSFFSSENKLSMIKGRIGVGFGLASFSESIKLRSKILGSFDMIMDNDDTGRPDNLVGYDKINDGYLGLVSGLGLDIGIFTVDLEYEYSVLNVFFEQDDTKYNYFTLTAGVRF